MADILSSIPLYGVEAVGVACETAFEAGTVSASVILNHVSRLSEEREPEPLCVPDKLVLFEIPFADCSVYDQLLGGQPCPAKPS